MAQDRRNIVEIEQDRVANTASTDFPGYFPGEDNSWSLDKFKAKFDIEIHHLTDTIGNFDLIGIDTSLANAFRRIMIAEIPSVAFERIDIYNNTSIIQDEVLAQRLGLVPLKIDPDWMEWFDANSPDVVDKDTGEVESKYNSANTVQFTLHVKCERNPNAPKDSTDPNELYINSNVYAKDLKYVPFGQQEEYMKPAPSAVYPDILLAKLRPGQEIELVAYAQLGIGSDHAKFSPVATASYRLLPRIDIIGAPISGQQAKRFQKHFPSGVIGIDNKGEAYVADARKDTVSREILRHEEFQGRVKLGRQRDHFIFNVETTGAMQPDEIFVKSINHLRNKAIELLSYNLGSE